MDMSATQNIALDKKIEAGLNDIWQVVLDVCNDFIEKADTHGMDVIKVCINPNVSQMISLLKKIIIPGLEQLSTEYPSITLDNRICNTLQYALRLNQMVIAIELSDEEAFNYALYHLKLEINVP